jgi:hypothetical protein
MYAVLICIKMTILKGKTAEFWIFEILRNFMELFGIKEIFWDTKQSNEIDKSLSDSKTFREILRNLKEFSSYVFICIYWMLDGFIYTDLVLIIKLNSYEKSWMTKTSV